MARGRMLSRDASIDPDLNALSTDAELLYLLTIPHLDRDGLISGEATLLWAQAAPRRLQFLDIAPRLINEWIERGLVVRYEWKDGAVLFFPGFRKHNANMDYAREPESRFPPPPGYYREAAGLLPIDREVAARMADDYDVRSQYYMALRASVQARPEGAGGAPEGDQEFGKASRRDREKSGKSSRGVREESGRSSLNFTAEDQDQHQDQHQHQMFDDDEALAARKNDDDGEVLAETARGDVMRELAEEIAGEMPTWTGAEKFIRELEAEGVLTLLTWLWLWDVRYNSRDAYAQREAMERYPTDPLREAANPVGKIITQTRLGNAALLHRVDRESLQAELAARMAAPKGDPAPGAPAADVPRLRLE